MMLGNPKTTACGKLRLGLIALACALFFCANCGDSGKFSVKVCGDIKVPQQIDGLRVSLLSPSGKELRSGVIELLQCPSEKIQELPIKYEFSEVDGGDQIRVRVQGLKQEVEVARAELKLEADEYDEAIVGINQACLGVSCPLGQSCFKGECELNRWEFSKQDCHAEIPEELKEDEEEQQEPAEGEEVEEEPLCPEDPAATPAIEEEEEEQEE